RGPERGSAQPPVVVVGVPLLGVGTAPAAVVAVVDCLGAFLQSCVVKSFLQSVFFFHLSRKSLTNASSDFCWFCDASSCLIVSLACVSDCWEAGVIFWTLKT